MHIKVIIFLDYWRFLPIKNKNTIFLYTQSLFDSKKLFTFVFKCFGFDH